MFIFGVSPPLNKWFLTVFFEFPTENLIKMRHIGTYFNVGKLKVEDEIEATRSSTVINYIKDYIQESETPETLPETGQVEDQTRYKPTDRSS